MDQDGRNRFEIPKDMQSMAEASFAQARKAFENFLNSAQQTASSIEDRNAAVRASAKDISSGPATGTLTVWAMGAEGESCPTS